MRSPIELRRQSGQAIVLLLIVLAVLAGAYWMLLSSRDAREKDAHRFARDAAERLFVKQDARFLNQTLTPRAQVIYPPSWRERFFALVRGLGPAQPEFEVDGQVQFVSHFFQPSAAFGARFNVPSGPATLGMRFVHTGVRWEIDDFNLTYNPPPTPTPSPPAIVPAPTATPTPTLAPRPRK